MATTAAPELMATAKKKQEATTIRITPETKRLLDELKAAARPDETFDDLVRKLAAEKVSPELVREAQRRRAIVDADELDIDLSEELQPLIDRLERVEETLQLLIANPEDGKLYDVRAMERGVDGDPAKGGRGAFVKTPWASFAGLHERDKDIPPAVAKFIRREHEEKAAKEKAAKEAKNRPNVPIPVAAPKGGR